MRWINALRGLAVAGTLTVLAAGCGSTASPAATTGRAPVSLPLGTSVSGAGATWAVIPMGVGRDDNQFWQLFVLPAGGRQWKLVTPPDVATNGAIAVAVTGARSLAAGIRPSQLLRFSPVTSTADGGRSWQPGPPDPGLADVPDALAAAPRGGPLLALDRGGRVEQGRTSLTRLAGPRGAVVRGCAPVAMTAVAFGLSGQPVASASCARPGMAGIFVAQSGAWHAETLTLPASFGRLKVEVLRLVRTGSRLTALLQAGAGSQARLAVAWQGADGRWTVSPALAGAGAVVSSALGVSGGVAVELAGRRGEVVAGPGASWAGLPRLPEGKAVTLALPASGGVDALAADGSVLTGWRLDARRALSAGRWAQTQTMKVPIQYGSSS